MKDYCLDNQPLKAFFDYSFRSDTEYRQRYNELINRDFQREAIADQLVSYNRRFGCSIETITNIEKLVNPSSVCIVAGQQAGILTGPLYTIHKIITVLKLAKEQEQNLNVPVVPIFWIAGEDHDFDEINHLYSIDSGKLTKRKINQQNDGKASISNLEIDKGEVTKFIRNLLGDCKETDVTKDLIKNINGALEKSTYYSEFFSYIIHQLFKNSGIVLLDSHDKQLRQLEKPFFKELINKNKSLNDNFLETANLFYNRGYGEPIERSENGAHLFYHFQGKRLLLERTGDDTFSDKQAIFVLTKDELLELVDKQPENFSNNVVTRPLMQEYLLPVLAFVGGPGEIAYWATLKEAFHLFSFKVPPIVPRFSMTLIEPKIQKLLEEFQLPVEVVIEEGTTRAREQLELWEHKKKIDETLEQTLDQINKLHQPLKELVKTYDKGLVALANKNELIIKKEITFLAGKIEKSVRQKYQHQLLKFDLIDANLNPKGGLQERNLNVVHYLNDYGLDFVERLMELPIQFNDKHKLIYLNCR
jgi:bacillithiol biosynthesis cysteine-adding enzyme BshC